MAARNFADRRAEAMGSPARTDRILIGVCAAVWLVLLGMSVAAVVALVDLGRGHPGTARGSHTPWPLYAVIVISALIILTAIPVLLRARRRGLAEPTARSADVFSHRTGGQPVRPGGPVPRPTAGIASAQKLPVFGSATALPTAAVDRIWLRGNLELVGAMGGALVGVATATYLMAVGRDGAAWSCYGFAAIVLAAMPVVPWLHLRQLREVLDSHRPTD